LRAAVLRAAVLRGLPGGRPFGMVILVRWSAQDTYLISRNRSIGAPALARALSPLPLVNQHRVRAGAEVSTCAELLFSLSAS
jgi:hypothetical protein